MDRRSLLRLFGLAPLAAAGQALGGAPLPRMQIGQISSLAGTLGALEPMEVEFVTGTMPRVACFDELYLARDDVRLPWSPPAHGWGAVAQEELPVTEKATFCGCDLQRLERKPGDRFVLTTEQALTAEQHQRIRQAWARFWADGGGDVQPPAVFICAGLRLSVVSADFDDSAVRATAEGVES